MLFPNLPSRKHPRLKDYDYSSGGAYFITICTQARKPLLSEIVPVRNSPADSLAVHIATANLTEIGRIAEAQLLQLHERYPEISVDQYQIMPDHIHIIIFMIPEIKSDKSSRSTITDIMCAYKSLTTNEARKSETIHGKLFQSSFYEHIIRNEEDYRETVEYLEQNPNRWLLDHSHE